MAVVHMTPTSSDWSMFDVMYQRELNRVFGYLLARTGSRELAEDLTAETFVAAARHWTAGKSREVTPSWLTTVAKRRLVDHWRKIDAARRRLVRLKLERATDPVSPGLDDMRVLRALRSLSERQRLALTLRYLDRHSVSEVADLMDCQYQAMESLLARARRAFARAYEELA